MTIKSVLKSFITLAVSLGSCLLAGYIGWFPSLAGMPEWYDNLIKPVFSPPAWVFPDIWIVSFAIMGFVLFLILQSGVKQREVTFALIMFCLQFLFTMIWGWGFFSLHSIFPSFMCMIALWATLLCTVIQVFRFSVYGGMLLVPYFMWVCFLAYLNYGIMVLNNMVYTI